MDFNSTILSFFLICILTSSIGVIAAYFYEDAEDSETPKNIKVISISFLAFSFMIIIDTFLSQLNIKETIISGYTVFAITAFLMHNKKNTTYTSITLMAITGLVLGFIPIENINTNFGFNPDNWINLINIIAILPLTLFVLTIKRIKNQGQPNLYANIIYYMFLGLIIIIILPIEVSKYLVIVFLFISVYLSTNCLKSESSKAIESMKNKYEKLDKEFNYELRKELNKRTFHLQEVQEKMSHINKIDNLTKAYNKKAIFNVIEDLASKRKEDTFSVIMFDIDNFKRLNNTFGHVQGDLCLKTLAKIAFDSIRDSDYFGRYGGDEFLIALPNANLQTTITIAERFRASVEAKTDPNFTISIGLATYPEDGKTLKELLDIADKGLYLSKEKGRNSVSYNNPELEKKY